MILVVHFTASMMDGLLVNLMFDNARNWWCRDFMMGEVGNTSAKFQLIISCTAEDPNDDDYFLMLDNALAFLHLEDVRIRALNYYTGGHPYTPRTWFSTPFPEPRGEGRDLPAQEPHPYNFVDLTGVLDTEDTPSVAAEPLDPGNIGRGVDPRVLNQDFDEAYENQDDSSVDV
jgi:hypothetical protein